MRAVPLSLREASYGLGARRMTTSMRVVVPAAISGIVAAMILAFSRAIGETMIVAIAAGASGGSLFTLNPLGPGQTLTGAMASLATGSDNVTGNSSAFLSLYFLGFLLFVMTLALNVVGDVFVRRTRQHTSDVDRNVRRRRDRRGIAAPPATGRRGLGLLGDPARVSPVQPRTLDRPGVRSADQGPTSIRRARHIRAHEPPLQQSRPGRRDPGSRSAAPCWPSSWR